MALETNLTSATDRALHPGQHNEVNEAVLELQGTVSDLQDEVAGIAADPWAGHFMSAWLWVRSGLHSGEPAAYPTMRRVGEQQFWVVGNGIQMVGADAGSVNYFEVSLQAGVDWPFYALAAKARIWDVATGDEFFAEAGVDQDHDVAPARTIVWEDIDGVGATLEAGDTQIHLPQNKLYAYTVSVLIEPEVP